MQLLLFSNSTNTGEDYLSYTLPFIETFIQKNKLKAVFVPFAGISVGFDRYAEMVADKLNGIGLEVSSLHVSKNMQADLMAAELIIVGGGNTFYLLHTLQKYNLLKTMREKVLNGTPFIGWSAGSNLSCPTIRTTNDMPIVEPDNFTALNLISFQINPHFTDYVQPEHAGETREMRIHEFLLANPDIYVAGLREGTLFRIHNKKLSLLGNGNCKLFKYGQEPVFVNPGDNLDFLMQ